MTVCAIYARKSTEQSGVADEQKSVARQIEHARQYAIRKGWTIADEHIYVDDGISGAEFANRPGFLRLMNALKPRPPFQVLIVSDLDRLGRESIETSYAIKQLNVAGVQVFAYLEDREIRSDSPIDALIMQVQAFGAAVEREKARQRTRDAMVRKAQAGHVTGGACFGYRNVEIAGAGGKRSHVEREIEPTEADIVRRIFRLSAEGHGVKAIAKLLNADGAPSPRAQCGRSQSWAPSSVRAVLHRPLYRGEIVWAQTAKRDKWGRKHQQGKPEADWIRRASPSLRIVTDEEWNAAHARLAVARTVYMKANSGQAFGRPPLANPSRHLLTNLALCGRCGGTLYVLSRSHGAHRKRFYGCSGFHERGICGNRADVPMVDADDVVIEALLDDVLDEGLLEDSIGEALRTLQDSNPADRIAAVERELGTVEQERNRLVTAIATGGQLDGLLLALQAREARRLELESRREQMRSERRLRASDADRMRDELLTLAGSWRRVLADDPMNARPIIASLLKGRVAFTPLDERRRWRLTGEGTLIGLFSREVTGREFVPNGNWTLLRA